MHSGLKFHIRQVNRNFVFGKTEFYLEKKNNNLNGIAINKARCAREVDNEEN